MGVVARLVATLNLLSGGVPLGPSFATALAWISAETKNFCAFRLPKMGCRLILVV
jgi:hypothetical protein